MAVTHQLAGEQEGNTSLCYKNRRSRNTAELCQGKAKATAAKVPVFNLHECPVFTIRGEKFEAGPLFVDMAHARQAAVQEDLV